MHLGSHWDAYSNLVYCKSWHGHAAGANGPLCGESSGHRCIPSQRTSNADLWCFFFVCLCFTNKLTRKQSSNRWFETPWCTWDRNILDVKVQLLLNVNIFARIYQRFIELVRQLNLWFTFFLRKIIHDEITRFMISQKTYQKSKTKRKITQHIF